MGKHPLLKTKVSAGSRPVTGTITRSHMDLLHTYTHENRKALVYKMLSKSYLIRFYENDVIGDYTVAHIESDAEVIADDYVLKVDKL